MKSVKSLFGHRAVQAITFVLVTALVGAGYYMTHNLSGADTPSVTWLTHNNVGAELSIAQAADGTVTAAPSTPVLLIECPHETCDSADLNLSAVIKQFDGKVKIVAIDPYEQKQLAQALESTFVAPAVQQAVISQLAMQAAQAKVGASGTVTQADVQAVMQDSQFQANIKQIMSSQALLKQYAPQLDALLQPSYAKFFLFSDKTFTVVNAATGVDINTQAQLSDFVTSSLSALTSAASATTSTTTGSGK